MVESYLLVIDAGTGGGRCLIFDTKGKLQSLAYEEWTFFTPPEVAPLGKEFHPDEFWEIICRVIKKGLQLGNVKPEQIKGVTATSFREGFVLIDKEGKEIYAGPATDIRALAEGMRIKQSHGKEIYKITGRTPPFMFASARLTWFKEKAIEKYNKIHRILMMNEWILYKFSGEVFGEPTSACETDLFDIRTASWSQEVPLLLELRDDIFPEIVTAGTKIGEIKKRAAEETTLAEGTPVVMGGADSQCGLLGMGLTKESQMGIVAGTTTPLQMIVSHPILDEQMRTWTNNYLLPNQWVLDSNAGQSGLIYQWIRDNVADFERETAATTGKNAFNLINDLVKDVPPGSEGVFAFLGPLVMDMNSVGPMGYGGFLFELPIFMGNYGKKQFVRAFLENMAFAIHGNRLQLEDVSTLKIIEAHLCGGLANSETFVQIVADTLRLPVKIYQTIESTGLGAAICAAIGSKIYSDFSEAIHAMVHLKATIEPGPQQKKYRRIYKKWLKLSRKLKQIQ